MKHHLKVAAIIIAICAGLVGQAYASAAGVLACRATEAARVAAGECGAHGCDCGLLRKDCGASKRYLKSFDREGRKSMAYMREAFAYTHDCKL